MSVVCYHNKFDSTNIFNYTTFLLWHYVGFKCYPIVGGNIYFFYLKLNCGCLTLKVFLNVNKSTDRKLILIST